MVRGGQKIQSKLSNRLHILQEVDVMIASGRNLAILAGVVTRYELKTFQDDLDRRILALTILDVINFVAPESEVDSKIYDYTLFWLHVFEDLDIPVDAPFCALVLWRLLKFIGLSPDFTKGKTLIQSNKNILETILEKDTEIEVLEFLLKLDKKDSLPAARYGLHRLQHLLECEVRGLRVLAKL